MESKVLVFTDNCFPRINYIRTRLIRFYPRMKNVLNVEFNSPGRGLKNMRSDGEKIENIRKMIHQDISVECSSVDNVLLDAITEPFLDVKPENVKTARVLKRDDETSCDDLINRVVLIATTEKDLDETTRLLEDANYLSNIILAVFVENAQIRPEYDSYLERLKLKPEQKVIIKRCDKDTSPFPSSISDSTMQVSRGMSHEQVPKLQLSETEENLSSVQSDSFLHWRESKECMKSPPGSRSNSPRRMPSNIRLRHKNGSPRSQSDSSTPEYLSSPHKKQGKQRHKKPKLDRQSSASNFQTSSDEEVTLDSDEHVAVTQKTETRKSDRHNPSKIQHFKSINMKDWDTETLKKAVSFQLEIHIAEIIKQIIEFLKSVRARRDSSAQVANVTTLDKLIYEIEGLLSQSITATGIRMKKEIEQSRLDTNVTKDLLSVDGVYGCGTMYSRLNVHIEVGTDNEREEDIKERIREIAERNNIRDSDYDVNVVKSRPGRLVVCY